MSNTPTNHDESLLSRITVTPDLCGEHPCIRGMRIRVTDVLDLLAAGLTTEEVAKDLPVLEADDIRAVPIYASRHFNHSRLVA